MSIAGLSCLDIEIACLLEYNVRRENDIKCKGEVIHIVREAAETDGIYRYGAVFVGMSEIDQQKINTYQMISEKEGRE